MTQSASLLPAGRIELCWLHRPVGDGRRVLLRALSRYLGVAAEQLQLIDDGYGKPHLAEPAGPLRFSWSHSGEIAVLAVTRDDIELGVDVERGSRRLRVDALAQRYFAPGEVALLAQTESAARKARFLAMWTAKEAVLKALGRGLAFGIERVVIGFDGDQPRLQTVADEPPETQAWQLHALVPPWCGLVAALAWRGAPREIHVTHVDAAAQSL